MSTLKSWGHGLGQNLVATVLVALVTAAFRALLASSPSLDALNWAELTVLSITMAIVFLLAIAVLVALTTSSFRKFWPTYGVTPVPQAGVARAGDDKSLTEIWDKIGEIAKVTGGLLETQTRVNEAHGKRFETLETTQRAIIDDYQRMLALSATLDAFKEAVRVDHEDFKSSLNGIEKELARLKERTSESLHSLWFREQIRDLSEGIRGDAAELSRRINEGTKHDVTSWEKWENVYEHWWSLLNQWWMIARFYLVAPSKALTAPDHMFPQTQVNESLFPPEGGAEAVRVYKKFRIIQGQWEAVQMELDQNLNLVAFSGLAQLEVRRGQPPEQA
jgi:hypothetical protein